MVIPNICYLFNDITTNVGSRKPGNISYSYLETFFYNILDINKSNRALLCEVRGFNSNNFNSPITIPAQ